MSRSNEKGFTLVELLVAIVVFSVVLGAVYTLYNASQTTIARGQNKVDAQQNARVAMGMAREIRIAGYDPSDVMTTAIEAAGVNTITFVADVDGDNVTERVTYRLQGTQLMRDVADWDGANASTDGLADGVTVLAFTYFDGNDVITAIPANIRRVTIEVETGQTAGVEPMTFPLTMDVRLRNL